MTEYLTNREAALHLCNGGKLEFPIGNQVWLRGDGELIDLSPHKIDQPTVYRKAIETITVNGFTVPKPVSEPLARGQAYWVADPTDDVFAFCLAWGRDGLDMRYLSRGLIHLTEAAAVAHAKAMIGVTG